jgi:hypothetical protein
MQAPTKSSGAAPASSAGNAAPQGTPELQQQVSEIIASQGETAEAMLQAQASLFMAALDIRQGSAAQILEMMNAIPPPQRSQGDPSGLPGSILDVTA